MYAFKYNQQDATLYIILYCCQFSTYFRRFFRPSSGAQTVRTASGICQACLLLPLAVAASKLPVERKKPKGVSVYVMKCNEGKGGLAPLIFRVCNSQRAGRSGDRIPVGTRFSAPIQTGSGAHPASCTVGTGSFPGVKAAGA
jgi:hypothetical protein